MRASEGVEGACRVASPPAFNLRQGCRFASRLPWRSAPGPASTFPIHVGALRATVEDIVPGRYLSPVGVETGDDLNPAFPRLLPSPIACWGRYRPGTI